MHSRGLRNLLESALHVPFDEKLKELGRVYVDYDDAELANAAKTAMEANFSEAQRHQMSIANIS